MKQEVYRHIERLEEYLQMMESQRARSEPLNKCAYQQAREMSAWLSLFYFGNAEAKKLAEVALMQW